MGGAHTSGDANSFGSPFDFLFSSILVRRTSVPAIWNDLREAEKKNYAERLRGRGIDLLAPADAMAARQVLFDIIDRTTAQIHVKAEAHHRRARPSTP